MSNTTEYFRANFIEAQRRAKQAQEQALTTTKAQAQAGRELLQAAGFVVGAAVGPAPGNTGNTTPGRISSYTQTGSALVYLGTKDGEELGSYTIAPLEYPLYQILSPNAKL